MKLMMISTLLIVASFSTSAHIHHLPLEMTEVEYQKLYIGLKDSKSLERQTPEIKKAIDGGNKLLKWINLINQNRTEETKIRLTSKKTLRGIPIDSPSMYGPKTIKKMLDKLLIEIPNSISNIVYGKGSLSQSTPLNDVDFISWAKKISKVYRKAVRWTSLYPYLDYYTNAKAKDVRGYYYLNKWENLEEDLKNYNLLDEDKKSLLKKYLLNICLNNYESERYCKKQFQKYLNKLESYKNKFWAGAIYNWNSFFKISNPRRDVRWTSKNPGIMEVVFKDPRDQRIANWLEENIEDEFIWKDKGWKLDLSFIRSGWSTAYIEFRENALPSVSGGNVIIMDKNTDINEYGVKWTIRHEYGHILRIPDCYHEFYDPKQELMINYQLDTSDLMCSRAGKMNERIYLELKKNYYKK